MSADEGWVFDSLICFLHSPAWSAALNTFIEEKSLSKIFMAKKLKYCFQSFIFYAVFDPNDTAIGMNPEIAVIHNEYKNLVN